MLKNKIYYLRSCDTCKRILGELSPLDEVELIDIKSNPITEEQLKAMADLAGNYEALFSRRARLYKDRNLGQKNLSEEEYKELILEHYTFLKRPVMIINGQIYIGNSAKVVAAAKESLQP